MFIRRIFSRALLMFIFMNSLVFAQQNPLPLANTPNIPNLFTDSLSSPAQLPPNIPVNTPSHLSIEGVPPSLTSVSSSPLLPSSKLLPNGCPASPVLSLEDSIFLTLRYNPLVRNGEIQRIADKFNLRASQYAYELQYALTGSLDYTNTISSGSRTETINSTLIPAISYVTPIGGKFTTTFANPINKTAGASAFYNPKLTFNYTQPLLRGYGLDVTLAPLFNAYDQEIINRLNLKNTIIQAITTVVVQYTAIVQAQNTYKAQQLSLENSLATVRQYQAKIKAGQSAPADIIQFQSDVANQQVALASQLIAIQQAKLVLMGSLGLCPTAPFSVPETVTMDDSNLPNLHQSICLALANDITYQIQLIQLRILWRQVEIAANQQLWQLDATVTQTQGGGSGGSPNSGIESLFNGQNRSTFLGLQLSVPINDITRQNQLVQSKVGYQQQKITVEAQKRAVIANATNAYNTLLITKQQVEQADSAVKLATLNLKNAYIRLNYGRSTPFEVSTLQNTLTNTQISLINTQISYINTLAAYEQVLGITLRRWGVCIRY